MSDEVDPLFDGLRKLKEHPQADLLEKLDMIKEAVKRNPDEWWREFTIVYADGMKAESNTSDPIWAALADDLEIRLKPQRVKVEGEVDAEVIERARVAYKDEYNDVHPDTLDFAEALLQLVKEKGDGK